MLSQATFKLISFELTKDFELNYYFEAAALLEAYQLLKQYQIPLIRLEEFWDEPSRTLLRYSKKLQDFLHIQQLNLPVFSIQTERYTLKRSPRGLLLLNLLQLKEVANLELISSVFTSTLINDALEQRHYLDYRIRQSTHAYVDLKTYTDKLEGFSHWRSFAEFTLPEKASLAEWLSICKNFWQLLKVNISDAFLHKFEQYFLPATAYLAPLAYAEFLQHFNMFLEDTSAQDDNYLASMTEIVYRNTFIPARLKTEFNIALPASVAMQAPQEILIEYGNGTQAYRKQKKSSVLAKPEVLNLRAQTGGAAILSQQAACPFKAFGHFQLKLSALVQNEVWLSQKLKGIAIHRILEKIWDQLKSQQKLLSLSDAALSQLVYETSTNVVFGLSHNTQFFLPTSLAQLEVQRLTQLIIAWLNQEKLRPDFKISALETQSLAYLGDLVIKLRLDRVDELTDGSRLVIDYKTGTVNLKDWLNEPLGDVQLPLYVLTTSAAGALFAEINNNLHFSGIVAPEIEPFSAIKVAEQVTQHSWDELKLFWHTQIHKLANDITRGIAHIAPVQGACDYCDLHALCRVKELSS